MGSGVPVIALGIDDLIGVVMTLSIIIFGLIKYFYKKETERVSRLETKVGELQVTSISRAEFNHTVKSLRDEIQRGNSGTHSRLDKLLLHMAEEG